MGLFFIPLIMFPSLFLGANEIFLTRLAPLKPQEQKRVMNQDICLSGYLVQVFSYKIPDIKIEKKNNFPKIKEEYRK